MRLRFVPALAVLILTEAARERDDGIPHYTVQTWAGKLGTELSGVGSHVTNPKTFQNSYKEAMVRPRDGNALVQEIAKDIKAMMDSKISAVKRIMDGAEVLSLDESEKDIPESYNYTNAKGDASELNLTYSSHFGEPVNLNVSAVHVPTNVFDRAQHVIKAIQWSEGLDEIFRDNFERDPSLSWQYFGSATGFMRQFPAMEWEMTPVDLFDCRTRSWYIEAASSPKDVLVLVDNSGSMTGIRREIARHVVDNILDTLGNNDFVNIITFSEETHEVVSCFNNTLVQANLANVRALKNGIANMTTDKIANFTAALHRAFQLLETYRYQKEGARCNQAIMLITDGVPYNYKEIFKKYNWNDSDVPEMIDMPVRVFTYLIGKEVADVREVKWMACANRGYYVHLSTRAEVREQVLNYVPVMARPLVLGRTDHPTVWTIVYADVADPKMTDWHWEQKECAEQRERFLSYRRDRKAFNSRMLERELRQQRGQDTRGQNDLRKYKLMTSVSMPVFDRRENATRIANLLGVAGTDVPIEEIQKLMMPHMLGVNGYAFIVTNNGYILVHPDLRPVFQGILKPAYNSVDMAEVELVDDGNGPREFDPGLTMLRDDIINQANGSVTLVTKYHYDDLKRAGKVTRKYFYTGIDKTPFTVVVSLPEYKPSGSYRVHATEEIHLSHNQGKNVTDYFAGGNWRVHPDWLYCKYHFEDTHNFNSSESQLLHFLERTRQPGWKWIDMKQRSKPPEYSASSSGKGQDHRKSDPNSADDKDSYYCDRNLLLSLVYDAKVTEWFANATVTREEKGKEFQQRFGCTLAFMATHSGLTRWQDLMEDETPPEDHFSVLYPRAIDEVWYKRAVEQYYAQPDSFVYSVPMDDIDATNQTLVTASRAIFLGNNENGKAPAAVVGFQFKHERLQSLFTNITYKCEDPNCKMHCGSDNLACYLVDNNGYVMAAKEPKLAGRFLGEIQGPIMASLVERKIFERIRIYDYQAVCFRSTQASNLGSFLLARPWRTLQRAIGWLVGRAAWAWVTAGIWDPEYAHAMADDDGGSQDYRDSYGEQSGDNKDEKSFDQAVLINRTKLEPCDQEVHLYLLNASALRHDANPNSSRECDPPYVVQPVDFSNMILLVVNAMCPSTGEPVLSVAPEEILYVNNSRACQKVLNGLSRRRPSSCIRHHRDESNIKNLCGLAASFGPDLAILLPLAAFCSLRWRSV